MRKPKEPPKAVDVFYCQTCKSDMPMSRPEARHHLQSVHGLTELKGKGKMVLHLDCQDHYVSDFELEIGGVKLFRHTSTPR